MRHSFALLLMVVASAFGGMAAPVLEERLPQGIVIVGGTVTTSGSQPVKTGTGRKGTKPKQLVPVKNEVTEEGETQIPARPRYQPKDKDIGNYSSGKLNRYGRGEAAGILPTTTTGTSGPQAEVPVFDKPVTIETDRLESRSFEPHAAKRSVEIFQPIETTTAPGIFSRRNTHPVPRKNIVDGYEKPSPTNKFYSNLFLGQQNRPVYTYPYHVWWSKGLEVTTRGQNGAPDVTKPEPFGLSMSHVDENQRQYGGTNAPNGGFSPGIEYYYSPIWIRSMNLGAVEFDRSRSTMELSQLDQFSVMVDFYANKATDQTKRIRTPLCLGQGFISAIYEGVTPMIESSLLFNSVTLTAIPTRPNVVKYAVELGDGKRWVIYAHPHSSNTIPFELTVVDNGKIQASGPFTGTIQIAKVGVYDEVTGEAGLAGPAALLDTATGAVCVGATLTGQVTGAQGTYQINYQRQGGNVDQLLMFALPHHVNSFETVTAAKVRSIYQLISPSKGRMRAVLADSWRLREQALPTHITWMPVKLAGSPTTTLSTNALNKLAPILTAEINQDYVNQTSLDSAYYSGKAIDKLAFLCLTSHYVMSNNALTATCLTKLKTVLSNWTNNRQRYKFVYDYTWRGVLSDAIYQTGDVYSDFGSGMYNDHMFHWSYFIHAAAVAAHLDSMKRFTGHTTGNWMTNNRAWVNALVRDAANPSSLDNFFTVNRNFDYWHGHSWAKGLFEDQDGKDIESSSEDAHFAYSMKLWGIASAQPLIEARGNLMLGILRRTQNTYFLISPSAYPHPLNPTPDGIHPPAYSPNRVSGILWENKAHHTTWFGQRIEQIQGIHMLPLTPISNYMRAYEFCKAEWDFFFQGKTGNINDGWKGILYAGLVLYKPVETWKFFVQSGFRSAWLDQGASRAWALAMAGWLGGAEA